MKCPYCYVPESRVIDTRTSENGMSIKRRRECISCGRKFNTYEKVETIPLRVVKRDGSRQEYDRNKVIAGIMRACEKRPITTEEIEEAVNNIESKIYSKFGKEVTTLEIGELVMNKLKELDDVAYVRFASVYRQFKDVNTFILELQKLIENK